MQGKTTWFDQESIPADANFQQEIYQGIEASDNFLVVLSPRSINSPYCADEVEYAASLNKRIVTVLHQAVNPADLHPELAKIQWIDFSQNEIDFATNFSQLVRTLDTDREHVSSHTKWSQRALEWQEKGNSQDLLLRGSEFAVAQNWLQTALEQKKQPAPTALQQTLIQDSHQAIIAAEEAEKQRQAELLRLQEEKTKEAEARLAEQKKSARRQKMFLGIVSVGCVVTTVLGGVSWYMSKIAEENEQEAKKAKSEALVSWTEALVNSSDASYISNQKLDALVKALQAKHVLTNELEEAKTRQDVDGVLQQAVFGVREYNRLSGENGHKATVLAVAISPDGQMIASGSEDDTVKLWNSDGKLLKSLTEHKESVNAVAFSWDGQHFASASVDTTIKLWKPDGTLLKTLAGHTEEVKAVAFSPEGKLIASASDDNTVRLWNRDGTPFKTLTEHTDEVEAVAFSPDGNLIASASDDKTIKLWKPDGTLVKSWEGHSDEIEAVAFSPDGKLIASASDDKTIKLWKLDGILVNTLQGHKNSVSGVAFSSDGETIASASHDKTIKLWNRDGTLLATLAGHKDKVTNVTFNPKSQTIVRYSPP